MHTRRALHPNEMTVDIESIPGPIDGQTLPAPDCRERIVACHPILRCDFIGFRAEGSSVEEFRGIPYASVPGRWQHSIRRDTYPPRFDASKNGYHLSVFVS